MVDTTSFRRPVRAFRKDEAPPAPPSPFVKPESTDLPFMPETALERGEGAGVGERGIEGAAIPAPSTHPSAVVAPVRDRASSEKMQKQIESILAEGLEAEFRMMNPTAREQFRSQGEKTASIIRQMIEQSKATAKKVLELIRAWLLMIPGINRFFLEQEAKIKTDRVLELSRPSNE